MGGGELGAHGEHEAIVGRDAGIHQLDGLAASPASLDLREDRFVLLRAPGSAMSPRGQRHRFVARALRESLRSCQSLHAMPAAEIGPTITAMFTDGPLAGRSIEAEVLEGRPPKTLDSPADDGSMLRYCLEGWVQSGRSAEYTFLYRV